MAPEVIKRNAYDTKADIWSLGITLYEIATGNPPYIQSDPLQAIRSIQKFKQHLLEPFGFSTEFKQLISDCLELKPENVSSI